MNTFEHFASLLELSDGCLGFNESVDLPTQSQGKQGVLVDSLNLPLGTVRRLDISCSSDNEVYLAAGRRANNAYPMDWKDLRETVFKRDNWSCQILGCLNQYDDLECHHIIPVANGGSHYMSNLSTLCRFHHWVQKGHDLVRERIDDSRYSIVPQHQRGGFGG